MSWPLGISLRARISLIVILGMLILVAAFGFLGVAALKESTDRALAERLLLAQWIAERLDSYVQDSLDRLSKRLEQSPMDLENPNAGSVQQLLESIYRELPILPHQVSLVDNNQAVIVSFPPPMRPLPAEALKLATGNTYQTGRAMATEVVFDTILRRPAFYLLSPVKDVRGVTNALVWVTVDLTDAKIGELIGPFKLGRTAYVEVVDAKGFVLFSSEPERLFTKGDHADQFAVLIGEGRATMGTCHDCHGSGGQQAGRRQEVLAFAPLSKAPWGVAIRQSEEEALAPTRRLQGGMLISGALALLIAGSVSWIGLRRLMKPLEVLAASAGRIAEGDLESPIPLVGEDEISKLSLSLEEMRKRLRRSHEEVARGREELEELAQRRAKELSALVQASESLTFTLDPDVLLDHVIAAAVEAFPPMDVGVIFLYDKEAGVLVAKAAAGYDPVPLSRVKLRVGEAAAGRVYQSGRAIVCSTPEEVTRSLKNVSAPNRFYLIEARRGRRLLSLVGVPLRSKGDIIGSLILGSVQQPCALAASEVETISAFAAHAATVIDNAQLAREASRVQALQEADQLKTEFLSNISHELRTPLTSIRISIESLISAIGSRITDEAQARLLLNINRNTQRLDRLVRDLLDMARLQSGTVKLNLQSLDLRDVVREGIETIRPLAETKKQAIGFRLSRDLPPVIGDRGRLVQVLINLLANASEYTPSQGSIRVLARKRDDAILVSVADTGPGIPEEEQKRIFERFYRSPGEDGGHRVGLGLGLPIAKAIVQLHGGTIWVQSHLGKGSVFSFSLPCEVRDEGTDH